MSIARLNTKGVRLWAVVNYRTGQLRFREASEGIDDWQAKIYSTKKIALKYAWPDEAVIPVAIAERPGRKERGQ